MQVADVFASSQYEALLALLEAAPRCPPPQLPWLAD
jgi:hypothetical protein